MNETNTNNRPLVLIVEDEDEIRVGMRRSLRAHGYSVLEAVDCEEAVALAERVSPALILTEEEVPTFYALTEHLRQHPTLRDVPLIIINPDAEEGTRHYGAILLSDYDKLTHLLAHPRTFVKSE
jgi:CheY-like chemotaxis protein